MNNPETQTIHLTPWYGGDCPVPDDTPTAVQFSGGDYVDIIHVPQDCSELWGQRGDDVEGFITAYAPVEIKVNTPRVDRSARGPVVVDANGVTLYREAREDGLYDGNYQTGVWGIYDVQGYTVRRLTPEDLEVDDE